MVSSNKARVDLKIWLRNSKVKLMYKEPRGYALGSLLWLKKGIK